MVAVCGIGVWHWWCSACVALVCGSVTGGGTGGAVCDIGV